MTELEKSLSHAIEKAIYYLNKNKPEMAKYWLEAAVEMTKEIMDDRDQR